MLALAHDLAARLPGTARALREGLIDVYKARIIAEATRVLDGPGAAAAEASVIADIAGKTRGRSALRSGGPCCGSIRVLPASAASKPERDARVELWREDAGTAAICGFGLPPDEALAADQMISARAWELKAAGVPGTMTSSASVPTSTSSSARTLAPRRGSPSRAARGSARRHPGQPGKTTLTGDHGKGGARPVQTCDPPDGEDGPAG